MEDSQFPVERSAAAMVVGSDGSHDGVLVDLRCSVAVIRDDKILLLRRTTPDHGSQGDWILPGGHPVDGESMRSCAARETREETGLRVDVGRCLFIYEVVGPEQVGRRVELVFAAATSTLDGLAAREPDRYPEFIPVDDLPGLHLRPPLAGYLRGLRWPQPQGAAYLGNLWRPPPRPAGSGE